MITVEQPEHHELRSSVRKLLAREVNTNAGAAVAPAVGRTLWRRLADEIGVAGLAIPERFGGAGAGWAELAVAAEEFGRALASAPYISTVGLATPLLLASGDDQTQAKWLPRIAQGDATATVAYRAPDGSIDPHRLPVTAVEHGSGWQLSGNAPFVVEGATADLLLVMATTVEGEPALFAVAADTTGVGRRPMTTLDETRGQCEVLFDGADAHPLASGAAAWSSLLHVLDCATVLVSAEQVAAAEHVLAVAIAYAKDRTQFGRPIASFQAIKHRCADLAVENDRARSALAHATWAAVDPEGAGWLASAAATAALVCGRAFDRAAQENIQIHGGIGFTWEHPAHRYFRRAKADAVLLADETWYVERLLTAVGVDAVPVLLEGANNGHR